MEIIVIYTDFIFKKSYYESKNNIIIINWFNNYCSYSLKTKINFVWGRYKLLIISIFYAICSTYTNTQKAEYYALYVYDM